MGYRREDVQNNFDLIRLFAAFQVAVFHATEHLGLPNNLVKVLSFFPGVPIFFFVSGFLIYRSYVNVGLKDMRLFFLNRALRIYPALYVCFAVTAISIWVSGYWDLNEFRLNKFLVWTLAQLSFFQFFNTDLLRNYGTGVANGSLWTISVEIQFYALVPVLFVLFRRMRGGGGLLLLFSILLFFNFFNVYFNERAGLIGKLFNASFAPWWVMFVFGAWLSAAPMLVERVLRMNGWILVVSYCVAYYIAHAFDLGVGNSINFFCYVLLSLLILKLAYTNKGFAEKILHGNDFSYGVYIYHMPVINIAIWLGFQGSYVALFLCLVLTVLLGVSSWFLIERPFLRLKKAALRKYS